MRRLSLLFLICAGFGQAQIITTVAGTESVFPSGGTPAATAPVKRPTGVVVGPDGSIYFSDILNNMVLGVLPNGTLVVVAGNGRSGFSGDGGPATGASLNLYGGFSGLAVDAAGNLYIADTENHRIREVAGGIITTVAGNGRSGFSGDGGLATSASLSFPMGVALNAAGDLFIGDENQRIRKVSGGIITTVVGNGSTGFSGDGGPATSASLNYPSGLAFDAAGSLFIADTDNRRIRKVTDGIITTVAGSATGSTADGVPATAAFLNQVEDVKVDTAGNIYIVDIGYSRIRKVTGGIITTVAGGACCALGDGGPATAASFGPEGIALDAAGNLFIAEYLITD